MFITLFFDKPVAPAYSILSQSPFLYFQTVLVPHASVIIEGEQVTEYFDDTVNVCTYVAQL